MYTCMWRACLARFARENLRQFCQFRVMLRCRTSGRSPWGGDNRATETQAQAFASVLQDASSFYFAQLGFARARAVLAKRFVAHNIATYGIYQPRASSLTNRSSVALYSLPTSQQTSKPRRALLATKTPQQPWTPHQHQQKKRPTSPRPPRRTASAAIMMCARSPLPRMKL